VWPIRTKFSLVRLERHNDFHGDERFKAIGLPDVLTVTV
jgi:hypothetical protein